MDLEMIRTLGPFVVAAIAVIGTFISAALAQRNWRKQFGAQQSALLFEKRLDIASELPARYFEALNHYSEMALKINMGTAFLILNAEGRNFPVDVIENFMRDGKEAERAARNSMTEIVKRLFSVRAFFNNEIAEESVQCLTVLEQFINQDPEKVTTFRAKLKQAVSPNDSFEQAMQAMAVTIDEFLRSSNEDTNQRIGQLAMHMVEYAKKTHNN